MIDYMVVRFETPLHLLHWRFLRLFNAFRFTHSVEQQINSCRCLAVNDILILTLTSNANRKQA